MSAPYWTPVQDRYMDYVFSVRAALGDELPPRNLPLHGPGQAGICKSSLVGFLLRKRRQNGGEDGCYREKNPEFCSVGAARSQTSIFRALGPAHSLQEAVLPQTNGTDGKRDSEGVPSADLESL